MKRPWEINIGRVLVLFLFGVICTGVSIVIQSRSLNPVERASLIKRACVRAQILSAPFANLFQSCREIEPGSVQQSSCGPGISPLALLQPERRVPQLPGAVQRDRPQS